jgi:heat-inducible transcriptional repressor
MYTVPWSNAIGGPVPPPPPSSAQLFLDKRGQNWYFLLIFDISRDPLKSTPSDLTDREKTVLHYVVRDFIEMATPVGSRFISRRHGDVLGLSPASIRNVMSDLEELGLINHPHTSAGRIPTDRGYRFYLDMLMQKENPSDVDVESIRRSLDAAEETEALLRETSRLLGRITHQLFVVTSPRMGNGVFEKLEMIPIVGTRIMVIISIKAGLVKTIMMEVASEIPRERLEELARFLNERLSGLTLQQIRETFHDRVRDAAGEETGLIRLFIDSVDKLFVPERTSRVHIGGTDKLIEQPEFMNPEDFRSVIELINDEEMIIHVLQKSEGAPHHVNVRVGEENEDQKLKPYSVIATSYTMGDVQGTVGVIGPTRMPYARMIPLVDYVATVISEMFQTGTARTQ